MSENKAKLSDSLKKNVAPKNFKKNPIKGTKFTIMVSSAKGGVGKSTFAINLTFALQKIGKKIAMAAVSIGVVSPIAEVEGASRDFTETRDEINKLLNEDSSIYEEGTNSSSQTGEEYTLNRNIGINYTFFAPLSRFNRIEGGISFDHLINEELQVDFYGNENSLDFDSFNIFFCIFR